MIGLPVAFASPLILTALLLLPALWWLLRLMPPRPKVVAFPPSRLLAAIAPQEETPSHSPWWLTLLRLLIAAAVIIAAAGPVLNPPASLTSTSGPLVLIVDDGWAAAASFDKRLKAMEELVGGAESAGRPVAVVSTGQPASEISLVSPSSARDRLRSLVPVPHTPDRTAIFPALKRFFAANAAGEIIWLSDGLAVVPAKPFLDGLKELAAGRPVTVFDSGLADPLGLVAADNNASGFHVGVIRPADASVRTGQVRAVDKAGLTIGEVPFSFKSNETRINVTFELPVELRNDIARLDITNERSAGAVQLIDSRWQRRTVGVISGATTDTAQPLLAPTYYLAKALEPFADIRTVQGVSPSEAALRFIENKVPMIVLTDVGTISQEARLALGRFMQEGGVLLRFAGSRLAGASDDLVPVKLRRGGRQLGGALSWESPQPLAPFGRDTPFADIPHPADVTVNRQVLAEPDGTLAEKTWAQLADGTPLVTAEKRGLGTLVLFHVSADTAWSNLPISGAFVEMLKRIAALSVVHRRTETDAATGQIRATDRVQPNRVLDGYGQFVRPPPTAKALSLDWTGAATGDYPPGFYGAQDALFAVNALANETVLNRLDPREAGFARDTYRINEPVDLRLPLILLALGLLLLDALVVILLSGGVGRIQARLGGLRGRAAMVVLLALLATLAGSPQADAQLSRVPRGQPEVESADPIVNALRRTRFAYVITANRETDRVSQAGLEGLTRYITSRTALEPAAPMGVDIERDELAFFPMLYWPIVAGAPDLSPKALVKLDVYMKQGGLVVFDTRDAVQVPGQATPAQVTLRRILAGLDIPELEPVPKDHVLGKAFYILKEFPGRFSGSPLWVEALPPPSEDEAARPARAADGVSPLLITGNDLAGAWAVDRNGGPLLPIEGDPRQRELAFRVGVNIMMYVLTGNYKADQVHVPALLERLGN